MVTIESKLMTVFFLFLTQELLPTKNSTPHTGFNTAHRPCMPLSVTPSAESADHFGGSAFWAAWLSGRVSQQRRFDFDAIAAVGRATATKIDI